GDFRLVVDHEDRRGRARGRLVQPLRGRLRRVADGQHDVEARALTGGALDADGAAVALDAGQAQGQSESRARAGSLGREERLEDPGPDARVDAGARVLD